MQFKVPQNVQIEDKILPFMTLKQLVICGIGGGLTYVVYLSLEQQNPEIWIPPVAILGILTAAIAFLKINEVSFPEYVLLALERYLNEQKRTWMKSAGDVFLPTIEVHKTPTKKTTPNKKEKIRDVRQLSKMLDEGEN